jgi:general secretion pathway protein A
MDFRSRFGFHSTPFTRELRVEERFTLPFHDEALAALQGAVENRLSAALVAPAGTGKTALVRALLARLPEARYRVRYVKVSGLSKRDTCREVAVALGVEPAGTYPMLVRRLQERAVHAFDTDGVRPVLVMDESQELRREVHSMLKVLTNFEMDSKLVLSLVLVGQPPLSQMLRRDELEDMARRIACYATLRLLSREETGRYVIHRCTIAGAKQVPFDDTAKDALYEMGRGNLRATDRLALKSLEVAHQQQADVVSPAHVVEARRLAWP